MLFNIISTVIYKAPMQNSSGSVETYIWVVMLGWAGEEVVNSGETTEETGTLVVMTEVELAGQLLTVGAQLVTVSLVVA